MRRITFVATTSLPASAEAVFDWHEAPGAFERLTPPWVYIISLTHSIFYILPIVSIKCPPTFNLNSINFWYAST